MDKGQMTLEEARAAWLAAKDNPNAIATYLARVVASYSLGLTDKASLLATVAELKEAIEASLPPELVALADKISNERPGADPMEIALEAHRQHDRKAAVDWAAREKAELARQFF